MRYDLLYLLYCAFYIVILWTYVYRPILYSSIQLLGLQVC